MVIIFSDIISPRLQFVSSFIFKEMMGVNFSITNNTEEFNRFQGIKISYADTNDSRDTFTVPNVRLLFETGIKPQYVKCFEYNGNKAFFKEDSKDFPFDIFSAVFYLLSRYEEYLPHGKDFFGRFAHENSLAFTENFLHLPLVNSWIMDFEKSLKQRFPDFNTTSRAFSFIPTYDIDIAFAFKQKGVLRNLGGFLKSPSVERIKVLTRLQKDPFDTYDWLHELHKNHGMNPIYFFLLAQKMGCMIKILNRIIQR